MNPRLLVVSGPLKDSTIPLSEGEITIGREATNGIAISDPSVSRKHCLVSGQDGRFLVRDLDSRNGTLVNGTGVEEQWLQHGDEIATGDSSFLFLLEDEEAGAGGGPGGVRRGAVYSGDDHPPSQRRDLSAAGPAVARVACDLAPSPESERTV